MNKKNKIAINFKLNKSHVTFSPVSVYHATTIFWHSLSPIPARSTSLNPSPLWCNNRPAVVTVRQTDGHVGQAQLLQE